MDQSASGNLVRRAVESLLIGLRIHRFTVGKGERSGLTLHSRVEQLPTELEQYKARFLASKWVGNAATHDELGVHDLEVLYRIVSDILHELYDTKSETCYEPSSGSIGTRASEPCPIFIATSVLRPPVGRSRFRVLMFLRSRRSRLLGAAKRPKAERSSGQEPIRDWMVILPETFEVSRLSARRKVSGTRTTCDVLISGCVHC